MFKKLLQIFPIIPLLLPVSATAKDIQECNKKCGPVSRSCFQTCLSMGGGDAGFEQCRTNCGARFDRCRDVCLGRIPKTSIFGV